MLNPPMVSTCYPAPTPCPAEQPDRYATYDVERHHAKCERHAGHAANSGESNDPLPAFSGTVEWGQIQGTTQNFQEVNVQNQLISAPASTLAPSDVDVALQLNGITPDQLGFVRIHDIQPATPQ